MTRCDSWLQPSSAPSEQVAADCHIDCLCGGTSSDRLCLSCHNSRVETASGFSGGVERGRGHGGKKEGGSATDWQDVSVGRRPAADWVLCVSCL